MYAEAIFGYSVGGYEWAQFNVYPHPREAEKYVTDSQSGCSCVSYETPSESELSGEYPLTKTQVRYKFSQWWDGANARYDARDTKVAALEKLNDKL